MKMPILWHERNLINRNATIAHKEGLLAKDMAALDRMRKAAGLLEHQILAAKDKNKDGFDADKFCVKLGRPA